MDLVFIEEQARCTDDFCVYESDKFFKVIINKNAEIDLDILKEIFRKLKISGEAKPMLILLQPQINVGREARNYIYKINRRYEMPAIAVITDTFNESLIANFYKKFYRPPGPYRVFRREKEAQDWLKEICPQ
jgi:hypothetical protein